MTDLKPSLSPEERARYAEVFDGWAAEVHQITLERFADIQAPAPTVEELARKHGLV